MPPARFSKIALAALVLLLAACATRPPPTDPDELADYRERNDPFEPTNRKFYAVNDALDKNALLPVARGYRRATTQTFRNHAHNVLSNLGNPAQFANDLLQARPRKALDSAMRLVINSTVGIGGLFDAAKGMGFPDHDNDFGLTLALWGVPGGPFLFLPVLGPTNPRDAIGYGVNSLLDPLTWVTFGGDATLGWTRTVGSAVVTRERLIDATDSIDKTALDPYANYRSLYQQHRAGEIVAARSGDPAMPAPDGQKPLVAPKSAPAAGMQ